MTNKRCYQCSCETAWLSPDGRCKDCTRVTAGELEGEHKPVNDNREKIQADPFVTAYVTAMFWVDIDGSSETAGRTLEDLAPETVDRILTDCSRFQLEAKEPLELAHDEHGYDLQNQAGHDFWLTRCGHGAGFWDRGLGEYGDTLSGLVGHCTDFPDQTPYLGDDGLIYLA